MENLTLVIPAKNEKESLPTVLNEIEKFHLRIVIVLEKEDKETLNAIRNFNCKIIYQKVNGYGAALIEGINSVETDYFCIFNADGSFNPDELENMIKKLEEGNDFVFASRYEKECGSDDDTLITSVGNFLFTLLGKIFFRLKITDILYTYVLGKTVYAKNLNLKSKDFAFCVELPIIAQRNGYKLTTSKSFERARIGGKKKVNAFRDGLKILLNMITIFFKRN